MLNIHTETTIERLKHIVILIGIRQLRGWIKKQSRTNMSTESNNMSLKITQSEKE